MAPITATSVGIPRQIIDDTKLINLLTNLSKFDVISTTANTSANTSAKDGINTSGNTKAGGNIEGGKQDEDGDITMSNSEDEGAAPSSTKQKHNEPPLDIDGLVNELTAFPKWQFQEQVSILI